MKALKGAFFDDFLRAVLRLSINLTDHIKHNYMSIDFHFNKFILL